ncbi:MAG TPA: hypothetical protein VFE30_15605 [Anaeromyxobacteraceae bacterium]|jgi:YD repeat-containing protein|nr:hypothetical protein [Anaeromyxobacteraceae bacterium]
MLTSIIAVQVLLLTHGVCTTGSTRTCKLAGCTSGFQVCLTDRTWGACTCNCDDGNACTTDSWTGTVCSHVAVPIDDGNPCTIDSCDPTIGVRHVPAAAGTTCSDGNACTVGDACDGSGTCTPGKLVTVADGNPCTEDGCDPATGVWHRPLAAGASCSDGNACNGLETCSGSGACIAGTSPVVDDGDPCTADACDPALGVSHTRIAGCVYTPPDPVTLATPLSRSSVTSFADSISFLYSPPAPIQFGADPRVFDSKRVAVLRGRVLGPDGSPLGGTLVRALAHPEFGYTYTRVDGHFDLAVNGGDPITLDCWREGFLPGQRTVEARWNEFGTAPEITLVAYDTRTTAVALGASATQVARGSPVTDSRGSRQATILFPPNIQAGMVLPSGTSQPLVSLTVRATEYTANGLGVKAMPGELPPTSGFTYAVELGVDEATIAGATAVQFNQPIPFYVDNFLHFPVGGAVPTGSYDRSTGRWASSPDGRVIKVLDVSSGIATLDVDGSGIAADGMKLAALGITNEERVQLAQLFGAGKELWRAAVTHFTPWDCNWPPTCLGACTGPNVAPPAPKDPDPCQSHAAGSIIECQGQTLGEEIPIVGTPQRLYYTSARAPGFSRTAEISIIGASVPAALRGIRVNARIAGQTISESLSPPFSANHRWRFVWDGKDAYGRVLMGRARLEIEIGYVYDAVYVQPAGSNSFALPSPTGVSYLGAAAPAEPIVLKENMTWWLGTWDSRSDGLGGWSLGGHHIYDPSGAVLNLGEGSLRRVQDFMGIETVAGGGTSGLQGIPAKEAALSSPSTVKLRGDGSVFFTTDVPMYAYAPSLVKRMDPQGKLWTVAGATGTCSELVEGLPATQLCLGVDDLAFGPDGSLYVTDYRRDATFTERARVLRIGPDGLAHAVAGTGLAGFSGDGGPAAAAQIERTYGLAFGPDGALYLLSQGRLRRIDPSGIIVTIAGGGGCASSVGDGGPASNARFCAQGKLAVGPDGSIYLPDTINRRVRRITPDGVIRTIAGTGGYPFPPDDDATSALSVALGYVGGIALGREGSVYVGETYSYGTYTFTRIRRISPDGTTSKFAGANPGGFGGDGGSSAKALLSSTAGLATGPDETIYVADSFNGRIRAIHPAPPSSLGGSFYVPSDDGEQLYVFDGEGRHLRTIDARTSVPVRSFEYTSDGWLASIIDRDGLVTRIERDAQGQPVAIVGPYGKRTALAVDAAGYLRSVTNPAGETFSMTYDPLGLLQTFTDPRSQTHSFAYTSEGRLATDSNPAGGTKALARADTNDRFQVTLTNAFDDTRSLLSIYDVQQ